MAFAEIGELYIIPTDIPVVVFRMGVDHPDITKCFIMVLPSSPEEHVHETGRAGQDGLQ